MPADCHIESYAERAWRAKAGQYRAVVVHTATGSTLYVTWPYASEQAARGRARQWIRDEYARRDGQPLFDD